MKKLTTILILAFAVVAAGQNSGRPTSGAEERRRRLEREIEYQERQRAEAEAGRAARLGRSRGVMTGEDIKRFRRIEDMNRSWRNAVFDATNRPLSAATRAVGWRRGVDTNCVTISVVTGIVGGRSMGAHAERDLTFDAEGRLVSVSPVCRVMSGTNDVLRSFLNESRGD